jgi:hypothetical protein
MPDIPAAYEKRKATVISPHTRAIASLLELPRASCKAVVPKWRGRRSRLSQSKRARRPCRPVARGATMAEEIVSASNFRRPN